MEEFKVEYFKQDFPNKEISFKICSDKNRKIEDLCLRLLGTNKLDDLIYKFNESFTIGSNLEEKNNFQELFLSNVEKYEEYVYMYNLNYDDLDLVSINDVLEYFEYLWYPSSDDYLIFDDLNMWVVWVSHYGVTKILKE